jgi:DNA integrity scanning protein DisA with diadenylate cyclase activity
VTASWNSWADDHGGDAVATVAGVPVASLDYYLDECSYYVCQDTDEHLRRRAQLLQSLQIWKPKPDQKVREFKEWKMVAEVFLADLYTFLDATAFISKRYFDSHQILFPDLDGYLVSLMDESKQLVGMFNDLCTQETEQSYRIDLEDVHKSASKQAAEKIAFLVDMAKAEALDSLGETHAATELVLRHL